MANTGASRASGKSTRAAKNPTDKTTAKSVNDDTVSENGDSHSMNTTLVDKEEQLRQLESDLNKREVELIEREIRSLCMQDEIERMKATYSEIEHFVDKTLEMLAQTIDRRDPLTAGHSIRVTNYSLLIGNELKVNDRDIDVLRYSALLHDYGKIGVPESILWKNGRLTPDEYACVQKHASITYDLLSHLPFTERLSDVPYIASCHHEKLDGTGYYRGLKGNDIPFLARVIAVADVFDALTSVRHYRNRMPIAKVAEIMESGRDNHFDPVCVDSFYAQPCGKILTVMESERGGTTPPDIGSFDGLSWKRLIELVQGSKAKRSEDDVVATFERIYNAGLPKNYTPLD